MGGVAGMTTASIIILAVAVIFQGLLLAVLKADIDKLNGAAKAAEEKLNLIGGLVLINQALLKEMAPITPAKGEVGH